MARKILLADDSVTAQNMGRRILTDAGYEVITVNNGSAALKKIAEVAPDLIVLDVYMPGYGGLEVCQRLKESHATARIPVLLTVGKLEPFKADEAKRVRADAHIIKPFDTNELLAAIIRLEDRIVAQPFPKTGRSSKQSAPEQPSSRRGREKSDGAGSETSSGWKRRLSVPRIVPAPVREEPAEITPTAPTNAFHDIPRREDAGPPIEETSPPAVAEKTVVEEELTSAVSFERFGGELASQLSGSANVDLSASPPDAEVAPSVIPDVSSPIEASPAVSTSPVNPEIEAPCAPVIAAADQQSPNESEIIAALASLSRVDETLKAKELDAVGLIEGLIQGGSANVPDASNAVSESLAPHYGEVKVARNGPRWIAEPVVLSDADSHLILEAEMEKAYAAFAAAEGAAMLLAEAAAFKAAETVPTPVSSASFSESYQYSPAAAEAPSQNLEAEKVESSAIVDVAPVASVETEIPNSASGRVDTPPIMDEVAAETRVEVDASSNAETPSFIERVSQTVAASSSIESEATTEEAPAGSSAEPMSATAYREIAYAAAASASSASVEKSNIEIFSPVQSYPSEEASSTFNKTDSAVEDAQESQPALAETHSSIEALTAPPATPERESELAAAWQNWKQIRESIAGPQLTSQITDAAAAGFKQIRQADSTEPEPETEIAAANRAAEEASAIAGIVDSVFAELKPKLMEEIARKLAKDRK